MDHPEFGLGGKERKGKQVLSTRGGVVRHSILEANSIC